MINGPSSGDRPRGGTVRIRARRTAATVPPRNVARPLRGRASRTAAVMLFSVSGADRALLIVDRPSRRTRPPPQYREEGPYLDPVGPDLAALRRSSKATALSSRPDRKREHTSARPAAATATMKPRDAPRCVSTDQADDHPAPSVAW
jgi:hypothetical protein